MNNIDKQYKELVEKILKDGKWKANRTGEDCLTVAGFMLEHNMNEGFPLLTSRKLPFNSTKVELEFFIKGYTDKKWLQDRGCHYWDGWCNPQKVQYGHDTETKRKMREENDLGLIYGSVWRDFHDPKIKNGEGTHVDQLKNLVNLLKIDPNNRRMLCSGWNPLVLENNCAALPSCHYSFQVTTVGDELNLAWNQRSVDVCCNQTITTYALLLHLLAKEANMKEGKLIGFLTDVHIYRSHLENVKKQILNDTYDLPKISTPIFTSIFDWKHEDTLLMDYKSSESVKYTVAI